MERRYYVSKYIGDGKTEATAFSAKVAQYGRNSGILDLRPDPTKAEGWCFAFIDADDHGAADKDPDIISLGLILEAELSAALREQISQITGVPLIHTRLVDVITEVLFRQGRTRPGPDGGYQIHLGSLIKELTADEYIAFIGRLLLH